MKKLLAAVLVLSVMLGMLFVPSVSAAAVKEITLFETDFENETVGAGASVLKGQSADSSENAGNVVQGSDTANNTKYFDTHGASNQRFRMLFNESVSSGKFVAEFDLNAGTGYTALGLVYADSLTTYLKWPFYVTNSSETQNNSVKGYTSTGGNPPADVTGSTVAFTKETDNENLTFAVDKWQHYKVIFDIDKGSVTAYIDGVKSNTVTGYKYFKNSPIGGLAFYVNKDAESESHTMFDNIKIYKGYGNYLVDVDYDDGNIGTNYVSSGVKVEDKHLSFNKVQGNVARYMFGEINSTNADELYIEFDVKTGFGGMGLSLWDKSETSYGSPNKFIFSAGTKNSNPARGIGVYTATSTSHPASGGKTIYTDASGNKMALSESAWQHVTVKIDLKNKQTSVVIDGNASTPVDVSYLNNININGITFKWSLALSDSGFANLTDTQKEAYIDNLKVYTIADEVYNVKINDFTPSYAAGETVTVNYDFTVTDFSSKDVELIVASYIGGELCDVNITSIENADKSGTKSAAVTLTKACDEIRAFAWEGGSLVPLADYIAKQNTPSGN